MQAPQGTVAQAHHMPDLHLKVVAGKNDIICRVATAEYVSGIN
jgi:hypothetical protein